jgi:hypothetical protein
LTWPFALDQQFATFTVTVHVANCKWQKTIFFVVNVLTKIIKAPYIKYF